MAKKIKASSAATRQPINQTYVLIGVIALAVVAVIVAVVISQNSAGDTPHLDDFELYGSIPVGGEFANVRDINLGSDVIEGVERGIDERGIPYIGTSSAPITFAEFLDFTCPHCARFKPDIERLIENYVTTGQARIEIYALPAETRAPESQTAVRAALCAGEQGAFWEFHDELFRIQIASSITNFNADYLEDTADDMGLDGDELRDCMNTNSTDRAMTVSRNFAIEYGATGTPTVLYKLGEEERWRTIPVGDGQITGVRPYETLEQLVLQANAEEVSAN